MMMWSALSFIAGLTISGGFKTLPDQSGGTLEITFQLQMHGKPLALADSCYLTSSGDRIFIDQFRFYVSALELQSKSTGAFRESDSYHLIDAEEIPSQTLVLKNVPAGGYQSLRLNIGTDSLINVSGAMGGDLDPTKGMYWAWNSGYINFKIEGRSNSCKTLHSAFEFHVGGYLPPNQTIRQVVLPLKNLFVAEQGRASVLVQVDLAKFFSQIRLETTNQVMIPSKTATQLADYFTTVFSTQ